MVSLHKYFLFFMITSLLNAQDLRQLSYNKYEVTSSYTFRASSAGELIVKNFRGDITVTGKSNNAVTIVNETNIKANSEKRAWNLYQEAKVTVNQTEDETGKTVIIVEGKTEWRRRINDNLVITVPQVFSVALDCRGGNIALASLQGEMDISTSSGDINLRNLTGKITTLTSGGDIEGDNLSGRVSARTSGGSLQFSDVKGELNATTSGGDIGAENIQGSTSLETSGGDINLYDLVGREIFARTSGGEITARELIAETTIDLHTGGGDLDLEDITGDLEASTSGGNIDIMDVRGETKVWTSGGEINAEVVHGAFDGRTSGGDISLSKIWDRQYEDHEIDVKTSGGDIVLTLPEDFPASFRLRVLSPGRKPGEVILSDFPMEISASQAVTRGEGIINGGKFNVHVEASMGTIRIRRED
ncbi:uncharacterized protein METZ01_LOCUS10690 [marine metagenome]|uniref:DUF4097 domain-containing protein n=1 Tax=marine metagenome TaxID=408172 RepID=A0A381NT73_9ZZZZ